MSAPAIQTPTDAGHPAPARDRVSLAALWFGLAGGPAAWSIQTLVNLPVAAHGCFPRLDPLDQPATSVRGIAFMVSLLALLVCALAATVALRSWTRTRHEHHDAAGKGAEHAAPTALMETGEGRTRFMALAGVVASMTFLLVVLIHTASVFLVTPCAGS
jgi:hypothetical protein